MRKAQSKMANQKNIALLVIDVQQGLFRKSTSIYKAEELLENINMLIDRAHQDCVPVFYIQHSDTETLAKGSQDWQLHAQLHPQNIDTIIHKQHGNAFEDTNLEKILQSKNITNLVITGLVTHGCVRATCIGAKQLGYRVILVKDGHSNYSKDAPRIIEKWNRLLSAKNVELKSASEVEFG
jgi:nicotinamidase-related amidase